ncbi:MAG TPA: 2-oxo acid dehydrogenase subunit E2 [Nocardioides sp.]|jgi:pyruvate dehydrogenase E2 component (dihydrolipoamide acetyltransferase)|nr:2-oxo acid dehydrogenase subunit E2 [Nocardioides sp.]
MPDVAADSDEGVLAAWLVEESARFDAAQTIAYVETQDELFSVEAGRPGVLLKTLIEPGTPVEPGTPIGILGEPSERVEDIESLLVELGLARRERVGATSLLDATVTGHRANTPPDVYASTSPLVDDGAAPSVLEEGAPSPVVEEGAPAPVSKPPEAEAQHHYLRARVRVDRLVTLSARLERDRPDSSVSDLVARSVLAAHRQVPQLGVARLAHDSAETPGIAVTYPGRFGVEEAAAVVPPGQAAALAVGDVRDEPVIDAGAVVPGKVMVLTLSVLPGRVEDVVASRWLAVLVALLERPEWMVD